MTSSVPAPHAARTLVLFAHGAGVPSGSPWMQAWKERLRALGEVVTFDYPYARAGRKSPDRLPKLIEAHREALAEARAAHPERDLVVLAGKSMGSRVGCHLALEEPVTGLICFGYPLQGQRGALRDAVLLELGAPIHFVQGTRDRLCPLDVLARVRERMGAPSRLHVVEEGDHSLQITKRHTKATGETQEDVDRGILAAVAEFVGALG